MKESTFLQAILDDWESHFPKKCPLCGKIYENYYDFLINTTQVGEPISYDKDFVEGKKKRAFIGTLKCHNCECGDTMVISSKHVKPLKMFQLMLWIKKECKRSGRPLREQLQYYNVKINQMVLNVDVVELRTL